MTTKLKSRRLMFTKFNKPVKCLIIFIIPNTVTNKGHWKSINIKILGTDRGLKSASDPTYFFLYLEVSLS